MNTADLMTPRLRLVTITTEMMDADETHSPQLSALLAAEVPPSWPPEHWEPHVFTFMRQQALQHPHTLGWNRYIVLKGPTPTLIGNLGGFPRGESEAEIGYALLPSWQHLGMMTEAVTALVDELHREPSVSAITAQTFPDLFPSIGVLERCGFKLTGPGYEEGAVLYRLFG